MYETTVVKPTPQQSKIVSEIVRQIASGELAPGAKLPPSFKLQEKFNTTSVTLSRAVGYLKKHGFLYSEERKGTFVARNPSCLCNIGLVLPYQSQSNFVRSLKIEAGHISKETARDGLERRFVHFNRIQCPTEDIERHHHDLFSAVRSDTLAGLIFADNTYELLRMSVNWNSRIPYIGIHHIPAPGSINIQFTGFMNTALDIVAARGRSKVAVLTISNVRDRILSEVFESASRRGLTVNPWWIQSVDPKSPEWAAGIAELLVREGKNELDSIVIADDNIVPAATQGIAAAGIRVPEDILVVAYTNFPHPTPSAVPVIRAGLDVHEAIRTAVNLIERQRMKQATPDSIRLPTVCEEESG